MKKLSSQSLIGQQGVNLVERIVLEMKYAWRPTPSFDVGIDGEVEVCDPVTGEATNSYIKVQVKSTSQSKQYMWLRLTNPKTPRFGLFPRP